MVPELSVRDLTVSLDFYSTLGFATRFTRDDPPFAYLDLGQAQLMLEQDNPDSWVTAPLEAPRGRGLNLQIEVPDLPAIAAALANAGHPLFRGMEEEWYDVGGDEEEGQRELLVQDPDGYLLRFVQPLGTRPAPPRA